MPDPTQVRTMFARIAGRYDLLNRVLSAGIDQRWRAAALRAAGETQGRTVVDVCCGTGDLSAMFAGAGAQVVGVDFTPEMLARAPGKDPSGGGPTAYACGDALSLPVQAAVADVVTCAFGLRNVADRSVGLREFRRVLKPGGKALVLEFTTPPGPVLGGLYRTYFTKVLPKVGRVVSKHDDAYSYLPRTVLAWPAPDELQREFEEAGFVDCGHKLLTRGIACLHWGTVPAEAAP